MAKNRSNTHVSINYTERPFGVPSSVKDSSKINKIFEESFNYQKKFSVSNSCGFVNVILKHCFEAAGIDINVVYGTMEIMGFRHPHVWLEMQGHIVDNTYVEDIPDEMFIQIKKSTVYSPTVDESTELFLGDQFTNALGIPSHSITGFKWFLQNQNKVLVMYKNRICLTRYYQSLVKMMKDKFGVVVPDVPNTKCWSCGKEEEEIKKCSKCKFAKYCSRECQRSDWKQIHKELCLPPNTY